MAENTKVKMSDKWSAFKAEFRKIKWPTKQDTSKQTIAVVVTTIVVCLIIVVVDAIIQYGIDFLLSL